jgi:SAM-dependent methyltransferase
MTMTTDTCRDANVTLKVLSDAAGRMRVHATGFRFDAVRAVAIENTASKVTGVHAVHAYPRTASVVIWYSPEHCDTAAVLSVIADAQHIPAELAPARATVVFDKTGTLKRAQMRLTDVVNAGKRQQPDLVLRIAAAVESGSEHPIGAAIGAGARERGLEIPAATAFANLAGHGVRAEVDGRPVVGRDDQVVGVLAVADTRRRVDPADLRIGHGIGPHQRRTLAVTRSEQDRLIPVGAAAAYERGRPSYPPDAIDWLLPAGAHNVLDLGAGTGKLTTRLVERGLDVVAVDPIQEMLEVLRTSLPETPALLGTAEEIPLQDNSVDAVLVAQAWHWFDPARAISEVARVLRPGGRLGLVWNTRDERLGWVRELGRIIGRGGDPLRSTTTLPAPFTDQQHHQVEWTNYLTPQALIDLVASRTYCITSPTEVRTRTLDQVRELLATHPALANTNGLALPYITVCERFTTWALRAGEADLR